MNSCITGHIQAGKSRPAPGRHLPTWQGPHTPFIRKVSPPPLQAQTLELDERVSASLPHLLG